MKKKAQEPELRLWIEIKGKIETLSREIKKLERKGQEIEQSVIPILKKLENQEFRIDNIVAQVKETSRTSVKYKGLFEKAMSMVNKKAQNILKGLMGKEPFVSISTKEKIKIKEAPIDISEILKKGMYIPEFQTRMGRLAGVLSNKQFDEFSDDEDPIIRGFNILISDDKDTIKKAVMFDDNTTVRKAATVRLSRIAPEFISMLREMEHGKFAQSDNLFAELNELDTIIDLLQSLVDEME